jgi:hypothetical protein
LSPTSRIILEERARRKAGSCQAKEENHLRETTIQFLRHPFSGVSVYFIRQRTKLV